MDFSILIHLHVSKIYQMQRETSSSDGTVTFVVVLPWSTCISVLLHVLIHAELGCGLSQGSIVAHGVCSVGTSSAPNLRIGTETLW